MEKILTETDCYFDKTLAAQLQAGKYLIKVCCPNTERIVRGALKIGLTKTEINVFAEKFGEGSDYHTLNEKVNLVSFLDEAFDISSSFDNPKVGDYFLEAMYGEVERVNAKERATDFLVFKKQFKKRLAELDAHTLTTPKISPALPILNSTPNISLPSSDDIARLVSEVVARYGGFKKQLGYEGKLLTYLEKLPGEIRVLGVEAVMANHQKFLSDTELGYVNLFHKNWNEFEAGGGRTKDEALALLECWIGFHKSILVHLGKFGIPSEEAEPKTSKLKEKALEYLRILSGFNVHGRKIMPDADYQRLRGYVDAMIEKGGLPDGLEPISQVDFPNGHIRYLFRCIHAEQYAARAVQDYFIDFIHAVFPSFTGKKETTKHKFGEQPTTWKPDLEKMKGG